MFDLLNGIRIVDLSTIVLGPYATQLLGDLGAEVIKVEPPAGDLFRTARPGRPGGDGAGFLNVNRNKRSIALDLTDPSEREVLRELVATADVFVHNMRAKAAARLGIDFESICAIRDDIVYCAARGYGSGPLEDMPAYDDSIQAASGLAALNAAEDGAPRFVPTILADKIAGLHCALAIAAGLAARANNRAAVCVEVPMYEALVSFLLVEHLGGATFDPPLGPAGYGRILSPDRRPFATADGHLAIMPYTLAHWQRFLRLTGHDALATDERVVDAEQRSAHAGFLYGIVAAAAVRKRTAEWIEILGEADIPYAPVQALEDLFGDPQLVAGKMFGPLDHPREGRLRSVRSPFVVPTSAQRPDRPAPVLDEDGAAIRAALDLAGRAR